MPCRDGQSRIRCCTIQTPVLLEVTQNSLYWVRFHVTLWSNEYAWLYAWSKVPHSTLYRARFHVTLWSRDMHGFMNGAKFHTIPCIGQGFMWHCGPSKISDCAWSKFPNNSLPRAVSHLTCCTNKGFSYTRFNLSSWCDIASVIWMIVFFFELIQKQHISWMLEILKI
jgi:hypothetical protein